MNLVKVNDELAVSPRVYRLFQRAARIAGYDSIDFYVREAMEAELRAIREELHVTMRCMQRGITWREYMEDMSQKLQVRELLNDTRLL